MALSSMTGFGQAEQATPSGTFRVEIRSVNNRYLELQIRSPRLLSGLESRIKKLVSDEITRGSVTVSISLNNGESNAIGWDEKLVDGYIHILKEIQKRYNFKEEISLSHLLPFTDVIGKQTDVVDDDTLWKHLKPVCAAALIDFSKSRQKEAAYIVADLKKMLKEIAKTLNKIEHQAPVRLRNYRETLKKKVTEIAGEKYDPMRIAMEIALMADKLDIAEECTRLRAHIEKLEEDLTGDEPAGKRLGFLLQEMNREANTIGSKANDIRISHWSVELKENIEKIREQTSNIE